MDAHPHVGARIQITDMEQLPRFWVGSLMGAADLDTIPDLRLGFFKLNPELGVITGEGIISGGVPFTVSGSFDPAFQPSAARQFIWAELALTVVSQFPHEEQYVICIDSQCARIEGYHIGDDNYSLVMEACDLPRGVLMDQEIDALFQTPSVARLLPHSCPIADYVAQTVQQTPCAKPNETPCLKEPMQVAVYEIGQETAPPDDHATDVALPESAVNNNGKKLPPARWKKKDPIVGAADILPEPPPDAILLPLPVINAAKISAEPPLDALSLHHKWRELLEKSALKQPIEEEEATTIPLPTKVPVEESKPVKEVPDSSHLGPVQHVKDERSPMHRKARVANRESPSKPRHNRQQTPSKASPPKTPPEASKHLERHSRTKKKTATKSSAPRQASAAKPGIFSVPMEIAPLLQGAILVPKRSPA